MPTQNPNFTVNQADLAYILKQIVIAEREVAGETLQEIIGPNAAILPWGLRHVDGSNNQLLPGRGLAGAADQILPRLTNPNFLDDQDHDTMPFGPGVAVKNTDYGVIGTPTSGDNGGHTGNVADADPRSISNLIVDMSVNNPAAIAAWFANPLAVAAWEEAHPDKTAVAPPRPGETLGPNEVALTNEDLALIPNQSPDIGLSPQFNGWMTFFGQFFDHGLDLITKGDNGTVYIPLLPDDPLYVEGAHTNFMALTRSTPVAGPGADGVMGTADDTTHETINTTTPWIDQNQTYTSHPSHQVFLREYAWSVDSDGDGVNDSHAVSTGRLLDGANGSIATWGDTKAQALLMLGIKLDDYDVHDVPLLRTDAYGNFVPGANGFAQIATPDGFVEGTAEGLPVPANAIRTGHAFLNDIAHHAGPVMVDHDHNPATATIRQTADLDSALVDDNNALTYDDEMLDSHFVTGDGRGNENIGLTAVHTVFHSEHNRLVEANKQTILASAAGGDVSFLNEWLVNDVTSVPVDASTLVWDGERLFQAAKFVTEMQYQHLVFEEFARKVQPAVNPFVFTNTPDIDPAITAEFAHVVYRFGHSMLDDTVDRLDLNMNPDDVALFDAFLNPQAFTASGVTAAEATGAIVRGMTRQAGNEIDEFVVNSLRNQLLGLPLDLAALNIARGREAGVPAFNVVRAQFYEDTGNIDLKPYDNWLALAQNLKNPLSIVNFIAAYGTHDLITAETTTEGKRAAATALVLGTQETVYGDPTTTADDRVIDATAVTDRLDFLNSRGAWAAQESGLNLVDLWIGGLAERKTEFGGMLGSTFNYVFENQMERLQNGDRLYYLSRLQGLNLLNELEPNTFSALVMRNSDLGDETSSHLAGNLFDTPDLTLEIDLSKQIDTDPVQATAILQAIDPKVTRHAPGADVDGDGRADGGYIRFSGGEHVVLGGTEGNDTLIGDRGIDTLWGDGGDDYLNAQTESDQVFGGDGDDIIVDPFGDNFLRGDAGNDVISAGAGLNILFGGEDQDFILAGIDGAEVFAGRDNDFVAGGIGNDALMGNEGDDWIEGGDGFDSLSGENSELFFNSPIIGHDILNGNNNDTDYDGESGDDIMVDGAGIQRNNGMLGFDWGIHKGDPDAANSDLALGIVAAGIVTAGFNQQQDLTLRDRFDSVEGLSGWNKDDFLFGSNAPIGAVGAGAAEIIGGTIFDSALTQEGVARIHGLAPLLSGIDDDDTDEFGVVHAGIVLNTSTGANILLGGGGSDTIEGRAGDDIIDGDQWLNVRIAIHPDKARTGEATMTAEGMHTPVTDLDGNVLFGGRALSALMLDRTLNPGQLAMVREVLDGNVQGDVDTAVFSGNRSDYSITRIDENTLRVVDNRGIDSTTRGDRVSHIELLKFADQIVTTELIFAQPFELLNIEYDPNDPLGVLTAVPFPAAAVALTFQWEVLNGAGVWTPIPGATLATFNPAAFVGQELRVTASYPGGAVISHQSAIVGSPADERFDGSQLGNLMLGLAGQDRLSGAEGSDTLDGGAGDDRLDGGDGDDILRGGAGDDRLVGRLGNNTLEGGAGDDELSGSHGNDTLDGGAGTDTVIMGGPLSIYTLVRSGALITATDNLGVDGDGVDTLTGIEQLQFDATVFNLSSVGTAAAEIVVGTNDADVIDGLGGADIIFANGGADTVDGGAGADTIFGGSGADALTGGAGADTLFGEADDDALTGAGGDDLLDGGQGNDTVNGGAGDDTITMRSDQGRDVVNGGVEGPAGDLFQLNGVAGAETFGIYTRSAAVAAGVAGVALVPTQTEIIVTRNNVIIAELREIEEIRVNTLLVSGTPASGGPAGPGDSVQIFGDFSTTSLNLNTIAIDGTTGDDLVDISSLTSAHRIVFTSNGGLDTIVGTLRPQDVVQLAPGSTLADYTSTTANGITTMSNGTHSLRFSSAGTPTFEAPATGGSTGGDNGAGAGGGSGDGDGDSSSGGSGGNGGNGGNGGHDDTAGNGAFVLTSSDVLALKHLVNGQPGGEDNDAVGVRTLSGEGNNRAHAEFGAADQPFIRLTDAHYGAYDPATGNNGINPIFAGLDPRAISDALGTQEAALSPNAAKASSLFMSFGQYFDHGLDFLGKGGNGSIAIGAAGNGAPGSGNPADLTRGTVEAIDPDGTPVHLNKTSPYVDQNQAYGSNALVGQFLREGDGRGGLTAHLLGGGPDPSNGDYNLLPNLREAILHHWANNTLFTDASLEGGSTTFRQYFAGLVDANGVISQSMVGTLASDFMGSGHALLLDTNPFINKLDHYVAGDGRANENIGLTSIHTIWARNHNYHVESLQNAGFTGTADELFQAAKVINEAEYQRVVFTEFADKMLGGIKGDGDHGFAGYNPDVDARISHEFATAAYRFGHSLINETMTVLDGQGNPTHVNLFDAFLNPTNDASAFPVDPSAYYTPKAGYEQLGVNGILGGGIVQQAEEVDVNIVDAVRNDLVRINADVFALDVAREWDVGIGSMNQIRADLMASQSPYVQEAVAYAGDLTPYASWDDFQARNALSDTVIAQFKQAYPDLTLAAADIDAFREINPGIVLGGADHNVVKGIDRVDLFVGGLAEKHINGGMVGQTMWVILHEQMDRLQEGDRLYYIDRVENLDFYQQIEEQGFAAIIARNTGLSNLPENVFEVSGLDPTPGAGGGAPGDGGPAGSGGDSGTDGGVPTDNGNAAGGSGTGGGTTGTGGGAPTDNGNAAGGSGAGGGTTGTGGGAPTDNGNAAGGSGAGGGTTGTGGGAPTDNGNAAGGSGAGGGTTGTGGGAPTDNGNAAGGSGAGGGTTGTGGGAPTDNGNAGGGAGAGGGNTGTGGGDPSLVPKVGTVNADVLVGCAMAEDFVSFAGDDVIVAGGGDDTVSAGDGADFVRGGAGRDVIFAGAGEDQVFGDDGADMIYGEAGSDRILAGAGNDLVDAGTGDDTVFGGVGNDLFIASLGDGADTYYGDDPEGGSGVDTLDMSGMTANVSVDLGAGSRGSANSTQSGADTLWSIENVITGSGNDTLTAGLGVNVLDGGDGNDIFRFETVAAVDGDRILGFEPGDKIDLAGIDANFGAAGDQAFSLASGAALTAAGQLTITYETTPNGDITVVQGNVDANTDADFRLELQGHHTLTTANFNL